MPEATITANTRGGRVFNATADLDASRRRRVPGQLLSHPSPRRCSNHPSPFLPRLLLQSRQDTREQLPPSVHISGRARTRSSICKPTKPTKLTYNLSQPKTAPAMSAWSVDAPALRANKKPVADRSEPLRESFDGIYLDLSKQPGRCRFAEGGLGWKPSAGGDTFTLDSNNITQAQWSRAARGYELKVFTKNTGLIQLDGFQQEVKNPVSALGLSIALTCAGL